VTRGRLIPFVSIISRFQDFIIVFSHTHRSPPPAQEGENVEQKEGEGEENKKEEHVEDVRPVDLRRVACLECLVSLTY